MKLSERSFTKAFLLGTNLLPALLLNGYMKENARSTKEIDIFNFRLLNYIIEEEKLLFPKPRTRQLSHDGKDSSKRFIYFAFLL